MAGASERAIKRCGKQVLTKQLELRNKIWAVERASHHLTGWGSGAALLSPGIGPAAGAKAQPVAAWFAGAGAKVWRP